MNDRKWTRLCLLLMLSSSTVVWSQTGLTFLRGTVTDPSGAVLAGADVTLENAATAFRVAHTTDQDGGFRVPSNLAWQVYGYSEQSRLRETGKNRRTARKPACHDKFCALGSGHT